MLEKDPGKPKMHRISITHLYEADYSLILAIIWGCKLSWNAESPKWKKKLHPGQHGGRFGHDTYGPAFCEPFAFLFSKCTRSNYILLDNDATSCYDLILPNFAHLVSKKRFFNSNRCAPFWLEPAARNCSLL